MCSVPAQPLRLRYASSCCGVLPGCCCQATDGVPVCWCAGCVTPWAAWCVARPTRWWEACWPGPVWQPSGKPSSTCTRLPQSTVAQRSANQRVFVCRTAGRGRALTL
uniref:Putative secreted protein n=1 Tax=Ixodes ricinus TaxID=34613 RepID=A0A147BU19_IXORI